MLQRTRAEQVVPVYERFRERFPKPKDLARSNTQELLTIIGPLGLKWRAPLMLRMAGIVADQGRVPDRYEALVTLPGVGPYAASAYLSFHGRVRAVIVDSNIVRWLGRVFDFPTDAETRRKKWLLALADELTPRVGYRRYNYAVLDLAMKLCTTRPRCGACPLSTSLCEFGVRTIRSSRAPGNWNMISRGRPANRDPAGKTRPLES
jgi:A/G-specific adenine glycosylase